MKLTWTCGLGLCVGVAIAGAPACGDGGVGGSGASSSSTTTTTMGTGGTIDCGDFAFSEDLPATCKPCMQDSCCDVVKACDQSSECWALLECESACADGSCIIQCEGSHAGGVAALDAFSACFNEQCTQECGGDLCLENTVTFNDPKIAACEDCWDVECCAEFGALSAAVDLEGFNQCIVDASDPACTGDAVALAAYECMINQCADACPFDDPSFPICDSSWTTNSETCSTCLGGACCDEFKSCSEDRGAPDCATCIEEDPPPAGCEVNAAAIALADCVAPPTCESECDGTGGAGGGTGGAGGGTGGAGGSGGGTGGAGGSGGGGAAGP